MSSNYWNEERKIIFSRIHRSRKANPLFKCNHCERRFYRDSVNFKQHMLFDHNKYISYTPLEIKPVDSNAIIGYSMRKEIRAIKRNHRKNQAAARNLWHFSIRFWFNETERQRLANEDHEVTFGSLLT